MTFAWLGHLAPYLEVAELLEVGGVCCRDRTALVAPQPQEEEIISQRRLVWEESCKTWKERTTSLEGWRSSVNGFTTFKNFQSYLKTGSGAGTSPRSEFSNFNEFLIFNQFAKRKVAGDSKP